MKECPQCHAMNEDDVKFCESCGTPFKEDDSGFVDMKEMKDDDAFAAKRKEEKDDAWTVKADAEKDKDEWAVKAEEKEDAWDIKKEAVKEPDPFAEKRAEEKVDEWAVPSTDFESPAGAAAPVYGDVVKPPKKGIPTWVWIVGAVVLLACLCCVGGLIITAMNSGGDFSQYY